MFMCGSLAVELERRSVVFEPTEREIPGLLCVSEISGGGCFLSKSSCHRPAILKTCDREIDGLYLIICYGPYALCH